MVNMRSVVDKPLVILLKLSLDRLQTLEVQLDAEKVGL